MLPPSAQKLSSLPQLGSESCFHAFQVSLQSSYVRGPVCRSRTSHRPSVPLPVVRPLFVRVIVFVVNSVKSPSWCSPGVSVVVGFSLVWKPVPLPPFYFVLSAFWSTFFIFSIKTDHQVILVESVGFSSKSLLVGLARSSRRSVSQFHSGLVSLSLCFASLQQKIFFFFFFF